MLVYDDDTSEITNYGIVEDEIVEELDIENKYTNEKTDIENNILKKTSVKNTVIKNDTNQKTSIKTNDENWSGANLETLSQWIQISSFQIEALELAILHYRSIVRKNVLLGLIFSTASGSISLSQMNSKEQQIVYNIIFIIMSFSIAIFTGLIKIYQIQERLEEFIKLKQEWIGFSMTITTEVQLPVSERKRALDLITKHKNKYLDLLKRDTDIPISIKSEAYKKLYYDKAFYFENLKRYKKLKELASCTDEKYFLKEARLLDKEPDKTNNCIIYKWMKNNDRPENSTSLSNILLNIIMEEENEQRNYKMFELLNIIRERRTFLEIKMTEYDLALSKSKTTDFEYISNI